MATFEIPEIAPTLRWAWLSLECGKGEANALEWRDIDFELAEIIVGGGKPNGFGKIKHGSGTPHLNQNPKWKLAATCLHRLQAAGP
jgi:hypothetical protein